MEEWRKSLWPKIEGARAALRGISVEELARRSGVRAVGGRLELEFLGATYTLTFPELTLLGPEGKPASEEEEALLLDYLVNADGTRPTGRWVGFRELPHGNFYFRAFQGYTGDELVRRLDAEGFRRAAERAGGKPIPLGDLGYEFRTLPLIPVAVVWWKGDEEFPPKASFLFDASSDRFLPTEGLAIVGRLLCRKLVKLAGG
jgi:hypothetical protein